MPQDHELESKFDIFKEFQRNFKQSEYVFVHKDEKKKKIEKSGK